MKRKIWFLALVGSILLSVSPVLADGDFYVVAVPGGVGTKITSLPYTITAPGFYYLTGNLTCSSGNGITVNADDVTIDLMGFRLSGNSSSYGIYMSYRKNVEIRNGTLRGWHDGIYESYGGSHRVINVRAEGNSNAGINLNGLSHLVKGCTFTENASHNIGISSGTVSGNVIIGGNYGISSGGLVTVSGNLVTDCNTGINVTAGSVIGNTVRCLPGQTGIELSTVTGFDILVDQNTVGGGGTHYSGGGSSTVWGTNAGR